MTADGKGEASRDPFTRLYDRCARVYNDHLATATEIRMSRSTMEGLLARIPLYQSHFLPLPGTQIAALTAPRGQQIPVTLDRDAPYGDALVRFESQEHLTTIRYVLVEWIHLFDVVEAVSEVLSNNP